MKIAKISVVLLGLLFGAISFAAPAKKATDPAPLAMLKETSGQMLGKLDKHIGNLKNNDKLVYGLVDRVLVPHFDLNSMSRAVIGHYWKQASSQTQQQFVKEFTRYVIRTYSSALQSYDGETIKFYPIRGNVGSRVQVDSDLLLKNGPPVQIQYRLRQQNGEWLIYDFSVDGVSIVKNYQSQFAGALRQGGLAAVVKKLQQNNARRAA